MRFDSPKRVWTLWKDGRPLELTEQQAPGGCLLTLRDGNDLLRAATFNDNQTLAVADTWRSCFERAGWMQQCEGAAASLRSPAFSTS